MSIFVSIVIPTYKRPKTLSRAVDSALSQSFNDLEIIVVDDNDPLSLYRKQSESVMVKYNGNPKVKYIKHSRNKNGSAARNTGIRAAEGKYIAFLDDDDEFTHDKIKNQYEKLNALDNTWAACYTNYEIKNGTNLIAKGVEEKEGQVLCDALMRNLFLCAGSNLMVRKTVLTEINGFDESFKRNQDLELLVRILQKYKIAHCNVMGLIVHEHICNKVNFEEITKQYLQTFDPFIKRLTLDEQKKIKLMINLQRFRYYALSRKNILKCLSMIKTKEVPFNQVFRYFIHLLKRYIYKESCGYQI